MLSELHYPWGQEWTLAGTLEEERFAQLRHRDAETTLDPTQFRLYSSGVGRWQSPDPASQLSASRWIPQTFNRYAYVLNNPAAGVDPTGLFESTGWPTWYRQFTTEGGNTCVDAPGYCGSSLNVGVPYGCRMISVTAYACPPYWTPISIRPTPPPVVKPTPPPPQPVHTGSYWDYVKCTISEGILLGFGNENGEQTAFFNIAPFAAGATGNVPLSVVMAGMMATYDLKLAMIVHETCMEEVYGHP